MTNCTIFKEQYYLSMMPSLFAPYLRRCFPSDASVLVRWGQNEVWGMCGE